MDNIVLISIPQDKLKDLIKEALHEELNLKKQKELLSFREAYEFLGISSSCLSKWKSENRIPYKKLGKRVFFNRQEILESLKNSNYSRLKQIQF